MSAHRKITVIRDVTQPGLGRLFWLNLDFDRFLASGYMGNGNFGAGAGAQVYFDELASALTRTQAARLAAILPDPTRWRAVRPGPYVAERTLTLRGRMQQVANDGLD